MRPKRAPPILMQIRPQWCEDACQNVLSKCHPPKPALDGHRLKVPSYTFPSFAAIPGRSHAFFTSDSRYDRLDIHARPLEYVSSELCIAPGRLPTRSGQLGLGG